MRVSSLGVVFLLSIQLFGATDAIVYADPAVAAEAEAKDQEEKTQERVDKAAPAKKKGLSDKAVKVLVNLAFNIMPTVYTSPGGKKIVIDKKQRDKVVVPLDDARRVIRAGQLSAYAQVCDMPALQTLNYNTMVTFERKTKGWSDQQTLFISQLHLFTAMWLSGNSEFVTTNTTTGEKKAAQKQRKLTCSPERKAKVMKDVQAYAQMVSNELKKLKAEKKKTDGE